MHRLIALVVLLDSTVALGQPTREMISGVVDHTFLKTGEHGVTLERQRAEVAKLVSDAHKYGAYSVCVREHMVSHARKLLDELKSPVKLTAVIGFPSGDQFSTEEKIALLRQAGQDGADEYDMVFRYEDFKRGEMQKAYDDVVHVSTEAGDQVLKVIIENAYLSDEEKSRAYALVMKAFQESTGGDAARLSRRFLKTSTGFAAPTEGTPVGAVLADVEKMHAVSQGAVGIKAAGGVSTYEDAVKFFEAAGAPLTADGKAIDPMKFRIGSSSLLLKMFSAEPAAADYGAAATTAEARSVPSAPAACSDGQCIQIGTYNIEFFGGTREPFDGVPRGPRTEEQIQRLADRIAKELDLEICIYEEINSQSDEWKRYKAILEAQGWRFFEGTSSDRNQFVILSWDADEVTLEENSARELDVRNSFDLAADVGIPCLEQGLRKPVAGRFRAGKFDFWVIGVHLKSRRGETACSDRVRLEQCRDLVGAAGRLITESGERDVVIVGDFNNRIGHASLKPLADAGFVSQMRFLMPGAGRGSFVKTIEPHESVDLIDQVLLRPRDTREMVRTSAGVVPLSSREAATRYIIEQSDHVPAWSSFRTDADLD